MTDRIERIRNPPKKLWIPLLLAWVVIGCAAAPGDGSNPTSPVAVAELTAQGAPITVCDESCVFEGSAANRGLGCAAEIRGTTRVLSPAGATLSRVDWRLDPSWTVRPGETFLYDGCCLNEEAMRPKSRFVTEFAWKDVSCSDG